MTKPIKKVPDPFSFPRNEFVVKAKKSTKGIIEVLNFRDAVRKRPAMFIGNTKLDGLVNLVEHVLWDAYMEALAGKCTEIEVRLDRDGTITIRDNGTPFCSEPDPNGQGFWIERVLTRPHLGACTRYVGERYERYDLCHGLLDGGIAVANCLSEFMSVTSSSKTASFGLECKEGLVVTPLQPTKPDDWGHRMNKGKVTHHAILNEVRFRPDFTYFPYQPVQFEREILKALPRFAFLCPGLTLHFSTELSRKWQTFEYPRGVLDRAVELEWDEDVRKRLWLILDSDRAKKDPGILLHAKRKNMEMWLGLRWSKAPAQICTYVNFDECKGGPHVAAINSALSDLTYLDKYQRRMNAFRPWGTLIAVMNLRMQHVQFEGSSRDYILGNDGLYDFVKETILEQAPSLYAKEMRRIKALRKKSILRRA